MKKHIISAILIVMLLISLCSCAGGIKLDDAKSHIDNFFEAIESGNFEDAKSFLHPERPADLKLFFDGVSKDKNLDFSNIEIKSFKNFSAALYDTTVGGSTCELTMVVDISGEEIDIVIEIVSNKNGFGIYNLDIK